MLTGIVLLLVATACWIVARPLQGVVQRAVNQLERKLWPSAEKDADGPEPAVTLPAPAFEIPDKVHAYCYGWFDQWAREESLERVKRLFIEHGNWDTAFQALLEQDRTKVDG